MSPGYSPFFRKIIPPWYDSDVVCVMQLFFMAGVFLFGCAGISAAGETDTYRNVRWVPLLLVVLSMTVILSTSIRLVRRREPG